MRYIARILLAAVIAAGMVRGAPFQPETVPETARWFAHLDVGALTETTLGQLAWDRMTVEAGRRLEVIKAVFGFDPRHDLQSLTLFGLSEDSEDAVLLAQGRFDADRLIALLEANETHAALSYREHRLHSWIDDAHPGQNRLYGAFYGADLLVIGRGQALLRQTLDVLDGRLTGMVAGTVFGLPLPANAPVLLATADLTRVSRLAPRAALLNAATAAQWHMSENDGVIEGLLQILAEDAAVAEELHAVGQGLIALGRMGVAEQPWVRTLLAGLRLSLAENVLRLSLRLPAEQAAGMLEKALAP